MRKNIIKFAKIDSTQNYAKKIAEKSPSGTIVVAQKQTQGRGRFERKWSSQKGGLYFSIILKPHIDIKRYPDKIPELTLKMAAAIIDALKIEKPKIFILTSEVVPEFLRIIIFYAQLIFIALHLQFAMQGLKTAIRIFFRNIINVKIHIIFKSIHCSGYNPFGLRAIRALAHNI